MTSTWANRDLPVLTSVVRLFDEHQDPRQGDVEEDTGFSAETVSLSLRALTDGGYLERPKGLLFGTDRLQFRVTGDARRAVGAWPSSETLAERIVSQLEERAASEPDETKRGVLRRTIGELTGAGRDIIVDVTAQAISKQMGM